MAEKQLVKLCSIITKAVMDLGVQGAKNVIDIWIMQDVCMNSKLQRFCHMYVEEATKPILELRQELSLIKCQLESLQYIHMKQTLEKKTCN